MPLEKKPSRSKLQKKVEDGAAGAPASKSKQSAGGKLPPKSRARKSSAAAEAPAKSGAAPRARGVQTPAASCSGSFASTEASSGRMRHELWMQASPVRQRGAPLQHAPPEKPHDA